MTATTLWTTQTHLPSAHAPPTCQEDPPVGAPSDVSVRAAHRDRDPVGARRAHRERAAHLALGAPLQRTGHRRAADVDGHLESAGIRAEVVRPAVQPLSLKGRERGREAAWCEGMVMPTRMGKRESTDMTFRDIHKRAKNIE